MEKILSNLSKKKFLKIVKYNKRIQSRLGLSINDYKDYVDKFSTIVMEIIPNKRINDPLGRGRFFFLIKKKKNIIIYILMIKKKK